jgi:hypothetical protein
MEKGEKVKLMTKQIKHIRRSKRGKVFWAGIPKFRMVDTPAKLPKGRTNQMIDTPYGGRKVGVEPYPDAKDLEARLLPVLCRAFRRTPNEIRVITSIGSQGGVVVFKERGISIPLFTNALDEFGGGSVMSVSVIDAVGVRYYFTGKRPQPGDTATDPIYDDMRTGLYVVFKLKQAWKAKNTAIPEFGYNFGVSRETGFTK